MTEDEVKKMLEENLRLTQEIHSMVKKMKRHIAWQKFMSIVYFLLIVVPIILSAIYLPPLLKEYFAQYSDLLGGIQSSTGQSTGGLNMQDVMKMLNDVKKK